MTSDDYAEQAERYREISVNTLAHNERLMEENERLRWENESMQYLCLSMRDALAQSDFNDTVYLHALDSTLRERGIEVD